MRHYHGSASIFKEFDKNRIGQNFIESERSGFFFTVSKSAAENFAPDILNSTGFTFEVELKMDNPVREATSGFYSPADYFDQNPSGFLNEAFIENRDGIVITGNGNNDIAIVFEPEQIEIIKVYEDGVVVFDRDSPEDTHYPEIMGEHVVPNVNRGVKSFHHDQLAEDLANTVSSMYFGEHIDEDVQEGLRKDFIYSTRDGRHFGKGDAFAKMAFLMVCGGNVGDQGLNKCRQDCLVIHDFDENVTMIKDLRETAGNLESLLSRPLLAVEGVMKSFAPKKKEHNPRPYSQAIGPANLVNDFAENTPDYIKEFTAISFAKNNEAPAIESGKVPNINKPLPVARRL